METNEKETAENKTQKKKWLKRKIGDTLPVLYVKAFLLMLLGQYIGLFITNGVIFALNAVDPSISQSDAWLTGELYFLFIGIWLIVLLALVIFKKNRPILACVGPKAKGNNLTQLAIGLALGFGMNAFCILIAWLNKDISLYFDSFKPVSFIVIFIFVFIQSSAEELLCRCYLYQKLIQSYKNPLVAIIGNSMLFGLLHLANPGITVWSVINIVLVGILFSIVVYYRSLWCAFAIHAAWNFTQNILFGLPNSGLVVPYSVFKLDTGSAMNSFAYDVDFGVEGTLVACIMFLLVNVALYFWYSKHPQKNED